MSELEEKIKEISNVYRNLQKFQRPEEQKILISKLQKLCKETFDILDKSLPSPQNYRRVKQVKDIQRKIQDLKNTFTEQSIVKQVQQEAPRQMSNQEISRRVARTIAFEELKSTQLKVSFQEIQQAAKKIQNNLEMMKEIQCLVVEQGGNLDIIQSNIMEAYEHAQDANKELDDAQRLQNQSRLMKIRAGVAGILGTIGLGILGIPGMFLGLFTGWKATK